MAIVAEQPCLFPENLLDDPTGLQLEGPRSERVWWVVYTKSRHEKSLARDLLVYRIPFYLPRVPRERLIRGRRVRAHLPMYPGVLVSVWDARRACWRAWIGTLRIVTRSVSEEERRFLADASGYDDPLPAFCATFRSRPCWRADDQPDLANLVGADETEPTQGHPQGWRIGSIE